MNNFNFGLVMTIVGMAGTLVSLWLLTLFMRLLKMVLPLKDQQEADAQSSQGRA